ncbi:MAG: hypothetical protein AAF747_06655 [Planctomycetota bacterium]
MLNSTTASLFAGGLAEGGALFMPACAGCQVVGTIFVTTVVLGVGAIALAITAAINSTPARTDTGPHDNCPDCSYSLAGLPDQADCPECGCEDAAHKPIHHGRRTRGTKLGVGNAAIVVALWAFGMPQLMLAASHAAWLTLDSIFDASRVPWIVILADHRVQGPVVGSLLAMLLAHAIFLHAAAKRIASSSGEDRRPSPLANAFMGLMLAGGVFFGGMIGLVVGYFTPAAHHGSTEMLIATGCWLGAIVGVVALGIMFTRGTGPLPPPAHPPLPLPSEDPADK